MSCTLVRDRRCELSKKVPQVRDLSQNIKEEPFLYITFNYFTRLGKRNEFKLCLNDIQVANIELENKVF